MLIKKLAKLFGVSTAPIIEESRHKVEPPEKSNPLQHDPSDNPFAVGLLDRVADGWFNSKDSEICPGVKVESHHTVADIGCGDGGIANFCSQRNAHVMFMDIDEEKVNKLEKKFLKRNQGKFDALIGDCTNIPIDDSSCDIVICTEVLEHVDDPVKVMQELARIGKSGSYFVLTVPDPAGESLMKATAPAAYFEKPNHIRIFEREEFESLAEDAGLKVIKRSFHGSFGSMLWMMHWTIGKQMGPPWHPMSLHWAKAWTEILAHPKGEIIKSALDDVIPKCQVLIARKTEI